MKKKDMGRIIRNGCALSVLFLCVTLNGMADWQEELQQYYQPNLCGPIALCCVCKHFGIPCHVDELASLSGYDGRGTTFKGLASAAEAKGLHAEPFDSSLRHLRTLGGPGIIDFPQGHFAVFLGWEKGQVKIMSPPGGVEYHSVTELKKDWGNHVMVFQHSEQ